MGGNMGLSTPYIQIIEQPPEPESPLFIPLSEDSVMYANGQKVPCMLNGFMIGCDEARDMLDHEGAIPAALEAYQNLPGFKFESRGLGIFTVNIPRQVRMERY